MYLFPGVPVRPTLNLEFFFMGIIRFGRYLHFLHLYFGLSGDESTKCMLYYNEKAQILFKSDVTFKFFKNSKNQKYFY